MCVVRIHTLLVLLVLDCALTFGDIPVVNVSISADTPNSGIQEVLLTNETGPFNGCNSYYLVCDNLAIQNWTLTVDYTSTYYNSSTGPSLPVPYVVQGQGPGNNILPSGNLGFDFDLCGTTSVPNCSSPTTTITEIDFSGSLDQSIFTIYDPTANGGAGGPGPTFFANPDFSLIFLPSAGFPGDYFESMDGFVGSQNNVLPEPQYSLLVFGGLVALLWLRRSRNLTSRS
jgi:hypothetical protein